MNRVWTGLASQWLVLLILLFLVILQVAALVLPQIPVSSSDTATFNRWLAELQPRLGDATRPLASLGLLTIRSSLLIRLGLGCLALVTAANLDRLRNPIAAADAAKEGTADPDADDTRTSSATVPPERAASGRRARALVSVGGLLLIGGWITQMLWGWQDPEVIAWPGTPIALPERGLAIPQPQGPVGLNTGRFGLYVLTRGERAGLEVTVTGEDGEPLPLLPSVQEAPQESLRLAFTTRDPEAFFAVPDAGLIVRLNQITDTIQIQAYRSASGDLLAETQLDPMNVGVSLEVDEVLASFDLTRLPRYEVVYNPGALAEAAGLLLLGAGGLMLRGPREADDKRPDEAQSQESEGA